MEVNEEQVMNDIQEMVDTLIEMEKLQQKLAIKLTSIIGATVNEKG
jgi:hypothetical protein